MKIKPLILPCVFALFTVCFLALWVREKGQVTRLATVNQSLVTDNFQLQTERNGLRDANRDLHRQLQDIRQISANLPEVPVEATPQQLVILPPALPESDEAEAGLQAMRTREPEELTPEQLAAREERAAAAQARREAWEARRQEMRTRLVDESQFRREFFAQVDTSDLSPEYRASHERLLAALTEAETMVNTLNDPELSQNDQREIRRNLGQLAGEMQGLMRTQREILLNDFAVSLGFGGEDARAFIDYIETVQQMTNVGSMMRGGRGGGPPQRQPQGQ